MKVRLAGTLVLAVLAPCTAAAQEHARAPAADAPQHEHAPGSPASLFSPRDSSGTAWLPEVTRVHGIHRRKGEWEAMLHANAFLQVLHEGAPEHRGATQAGSINWIMGMARRPLGDGWMGVRAMVSLEPWTIGGCGYPNLLATGEFCERDGIHDRQHPHDLFMELAGEYERPMTSTLRWHVYGGPAGEPALGPVAFPHRLSAMPNPLSPIAHHWLDATHITYGVVTTGLSSTRWRAEVSLFNGREPDERRWDVDLAALDSVSARLSVAASPSLMLQMSAGHLTEAEPVHAGQVGLDVERVTASGTYHLPLRQKGFLAATLTWGMNHEAGRSTHGVVLEASGGLSDRHVVFARGEVNGKPAHDLHIHESSGVFTVGKLQGGYTHYLPARRGLTPGVGGSLSASFVPVPLQPRYGGVGLGVAVFVTIRPAPHMMLR
jgi:hypothetical protein